MRIISPFGDYKHLVLFDEDDSTRALIEMPEPVSAMRLAQTLKSAMYENLFTVEAKLGGKIQIHANLDTSSEEENPNINDVYWSDQRSEHEEAKSAFAQTQNQLPIKRDMVPSLTTFDHVPPPRNNGPAPYSETNIMTSNLPAQMAIRKNMPPSRSLIDLNRQMNIIPRTQESRSHQIISTYTNFPSRSNHP
eukprot:TRINITY_DN15244_c0_g1_i1.p1 TRINITY_DN15244_c0_g1~~TRINITY_DN15244_c0_g1_i1.p1  ORF type:complete len:192 (+),score=32.39 TRINITY_DN15244_c0_g1_i1:211-786(+)